jgi:plasmid stabilization system protein ParE
MTSEIHPEAEVEFQEATDWYAGQSLNAGERFVAEMEASFAMIIRDPLRFEPAGTGVRVCRLQHFPYKLYYEFDEVRQHIRLLSVMHHKRRPDYWRGRGAHD